ncbi:MAG: hypothetical protein WDN69_17640 [Aliidongia sp.]
MIGDDVTHVTPPARFLSCTVLCWRPQPARTNPSSGRRNWGPKVHRLTVDLAGDEPAEVRLAKAATAICPAGYDRQEDEPMPPDSPHCRVWLVRCR